MNRLQHETSPYLLQHAANPVDWYPWGTEALERARAEDRPILLSIGYAACHWCHVMEHESFENEATAALMNELFVNIKVDREERPDIDSIYMQAVQAMTGHGGWPMTMFLTPSGEPFYGGTYFPPTDRHGLPAFARVLRAVADAYRSDDGAVANTVERLREMYRAGSSASGTGTPLTRETLERATAGLERQYDQRNHGFGGAPKFPPTMALDFLLRNWARTGDERSLDMVRGTFDAMTRGGTYDQVAGGLHRYSVDAQWLVPHFEKMLYDNALLARLGVHLWQATHDDGVRRVTEQTFGWLLREMTSPEGGFYSSLDADSEGHEGKFYVWSDDELNSILGDDAQLVKRLWGVTPGGNFEGSNILHHPVPLSTVAAELNISVPDALQLLSMAAERLYGHRSRRVWPARDDKVLAGWNGLMLRALAEGARAFDDEVLYAAAVRNGEFLRAQLVDDGQVYRSYKDGKRLSVGFLEDHAAVALAFLELYATSADSEWLLHARRINTRVIERFYDAERGQFFDTPTDHEALITRPRDVTDNALPAGHSLAIELQQRLGVIDDDAVLRDIASRQLEKLHDAMAIHPTAFGHLLGVADMVVFGEVELAVIGRTADDARRLLNEVSSVYAPSLVVVSTTIEPIHETALTRGRDAGAGSARGYVCRRYVCESPSDDAQVLTEQLLRAGKGSTS